MKKTQRHTYSYWGNRSAVDWLRGWLEETNTTVKELAPKVNLSEKTLYRIRSGRRVSLSSLERIAECFGEELPACIAEIASRRYVRHGFSNGEKRSEYRAFKNMHQRVSNPNHPDYPRYGGAGKTIDPRWANTPEGFENFYHDVGPRPSNRHSLHRYPTDANYGPGTCKWATPRQQRIERTGSTVWEINGEDMTTNEFVKQSEKDGFACVVKVPKRRDSQEAAKEANQQR